MHVSGGQLHGSFLNIASHCTCMICSCSPLLDDVNPIDSGPNSPPLNFLPYFLILNVGGVYLFNDRDDASTDTDDNAIANAAT